MLNQTNEKEPVLAPPGAGLPLVELWIARWRFRRALARTTREQAEAQFAKERDEILELARGCDAATGSRRVLIKRLRGMEDSSRFWSVFMTLDHLRIVNIACAEAIKSLGRGKVPERVGSTANVKPSPEAGIGAVEDFLRSCEYFQQRAKEVVDLKTRERYAHPWFGPLDAAGWHFLGGFHMVLHKRQIQEILALVGKG
jgi:hypothetical protein